MMQIRFGINESSNDHSTWKSDSETRSPFFLPLGSWSTRIDSSKQHIGISNIYIDVHISCRKKKSSVCVYTMRHQCVCIVTHQSVCISIQYRFFLASWMARWIAIDGCHLFRECWFNHDLADRCDPMQLRPKMLRGKTPPNKTRLSWVVC